MGEELPPLWAGQGWAGRCGVSDLQREVAGRTVSAPAALWTGLIVVNAWYGKFVKDKSRKNERVKVIDVTVPLQCLVKDSKLILTEASKVTARPAVTVSLQSLDGFCAGATGCSHGP